MTEKLKAYNTIIQPFLHQEVGWFLKKYGINYFSYQRFYEDGRHISLFSSPTWSDFYLTHMNVDSPAFSAMVTNLDPQCLNPRLWPTSLCDPVVNALHHHNLWNGISIYKKCEEGLEAWEFCGNRESGNLLNFYLAESNLLKQFILYLRPRLAPYLYPSDASVYTHFANSHPEEKVSFDWTNASPSLFCIGYNGPITLSQQETKCINGLKKGHAAKEIAYYLGLKPRTVEEYLANVRKKLGVQKNTQIMSLLEGMPRKSEP